jgi:ankyrin repeat protein
VDGDDVDACLVVLIRLTTLPNFNPLYLFPSLCRSRSLVMSELLLDFDAPMNPYINLYALETPLTAAIRNERADLVHMLLRGGANPNIPNARGSFTISYI